MNNNNGDDGYDGNENAGGDRPYTSGAHPKIPAELRDDSHFKHTRSNNNRATLEASQSTAAAAVNDFDEDNPKGVVCFYYRALAIVGTDVVGLDHGAFQCYAFLKEVDLSKALSLQIIAQAAFARCVALALVRWPPNLKAIGDAAFTECTSLEEADMSKLLALETIGDYAFAFCSALALVRWSPILKTIGDSAFAYCRNLKEVDMSKLHALETIGNCAFARCSALALVKWPPNLKTIGGYAFLLCRSLEEVDMSNLHALNIIEGGAFQNCSALVIVKWAPKTETIRYDAFEGCRLHDIMIPLRHHWFVRKLPFDEDETKLQSVDMQGNDLKKAIRIKNLYPRATPMLTMNRLVSMYAKSPLTAAQLENAAHSDVGVTEEDWAEARLGDLQRLEGIQKAYAGSIFNLLHWYAANGLAENLFVNRSNEI